MRLTRVHIPVYLGALHAGAEVALPANAAEHVTRVLRLRAGASLIAFDGHGGEWQAELTQVARGHVTLRCLTHLSIERESPLQITLLQSLARGEKMDWIIQKATELGVHCVVPVSSARSVVQIDDERAAARLQHWRAVAASACEQCGRNRLPEITAPMSLREACETALPAPRLLLAPAAANSVAAVIGIAGAVTLLVGPEGGFAPEEIAISERNGFKAVSLGPRILRTETAAIAAITALQLLGGDLKA